MAMLVSNLQMGQMWAVHQGKNRAIVPTIAALVTVIESMVSLEVFVPKEWHKAPITHFKT